MDNIESGQQFVKANPNAGAQREMRQAIGESLGKQVGRIGTC